MCITYAMFMYLTIISGAIPPMCWDAR